MKQRTPTELLNVVAIDGPVGVGKSSVARQVADRLGFVHLDTGAMYRAVALKYLRLPEHERNDTALVRIANALDLDFREDKSIWLEGEDISQAIRSEEVSRHVYLSADNRGVREALVSRQREIGSRRPSVLEGRDIATVVFPDARWKIYLDAAPDIRAMRRVKQLHAAHQSAEFEEVRRNLLDRDARDRSREWGALQIAEDATVLDTSHLGEGAVVDLICEYVQNS